MLAIMANKNSLVVKTSVTKQNNDKKELIGDCGQVLYNGNSTQLHVHTCLEIKELNCT